jgi:hypothetical protein
MNFIDIIGWVGSACVVYAFTMNIFGKLATTSSLYFILNILGSILLIVNTYFHQAYPSMAVNIIWVLVAIGALIKKPK